MTAKPLGWLRGKLKTPRVGQEARREAGALLRRLQDGEQLSLPESRPMVSVGRRVHELRVQDAQSQLTWRIFYRIDPDAILVVEWFAKKTQTTPKKVIDTCKRRLHAYDEASRRGRKEKG
jgi:phage-related protein